MNKLLSIERKGEVIFQCTDPWYVPRVGESVALAKWDTIYKVESVFTVFGKGNDVEIVTVNVVIDR